MALNAGLSLRSASPAGSDISQRPQSRRIRDQDEILGKDKVFRRYASGVERSLSLFDSTLQGWADYISFLSRLLKSLESHPEGISVIPHKVLVAKRLAQCLQAALPSGVHQKTLEVYAFIFGLIGKDGLEEDLGVYLPGIASTLTFGSIAVRSRFLSLIELHVLKVPSDALRPALKSVILALLPGLEEEASDDFEKTLQALNRCRTSFRNVGQGEVFWQNLFLASITSPGKRQGVLAYLIRFLPKLPGPSSGGLSTDVVELVTPEPGLLLRCFITGLADDQVLVQRAFLDLLVSHMPLHAPIFQGAVAAKDLHLLVSAAVGVVLRRDMSLNRRLWSWFLGPDTEKDEIAQSSTETRAPLTADSETARAKNSYLQEYGVQPLVAAQESLVALDSEVPSEVSRPFRIALSLMDRWEIGNPVVNAVFLPLMRNLRAFRQSAPSAPDFDEVFRSANVFFDGVESTLIWSKMLFLLLPDGKSEKEALLDLELASFILGNFNVTEDEMISLHIPLVSLAMLDSLSEAPVPSPSSSAVKLEIRSYLYDLLEVLLDVMPRKSLLSDTEKPPVNTILPGDSSTASRIKSFYEQNEQLLQTSEPPFLPGDAGKYLFLLTSNMIMSQLQEDVKCRDLERTVQLMNLLVEKISEKVTFDSFAMAKALKGRLLSEIRSASSFPFTSAAVSLYEVLEYWSTKVENVDADLMAAILAELTRRLWEFLSSTTPQYHVRVLSLLIDLHVDTWQEELVTSALLREIASDLTATGRGLECFAAFWTHANTALLSPEARGLQNTAGHRSKARDRKAAMPGFSTMLNTALLMVLNALHSSRDKHFSMCRNWLQNVPDLSSILHYLLEGSRINSRAGSPSVCDELDASICKFELLERVLEYQTGEQWDRFGSPSSMTKDSSDQNGSQEASQALAVLVLRNCSEILGQTEPSDKTASESLSRLQQGALSVTRSIFRNISSVSLFITRIDKAVVQKLASLESLADLSLRSDLLETLILLIKSKSKASVSFSNPRRSRERPGSSQNPINGASQDSGDGLNGLPQFLEPPEKLLDCMGKGISDPLRIDADKWVQVLTLSLPLYSATFFPTSMLAVETLCQQIHACFDSLKIQYESQSPPAGDYESAIFHFLNGLDYLLARTHEFLLAQEEDVQTAKSPEPIQGLFGSMLSGSAPASNKQPGNLMKNHRFSVILSFRDAIKASFELWSWQAPDSMPSSMLMPSFQYVSQKLRSRSRRILEHVLSAEPLESIEVLIEIWSRARSNGDSIQTSSVLTLFHVLESSRPNIVMGTLFNAIYARTDRDNLDLAHAPTLSSTLSESDLIIFMNNYTLSLEEDVLDEIWADCMDFLRSVLSNPMPHRHILARLIRFIAILGTKMEKTNFGEERKMRKELGDLLVRLLTAIFTIKPQSVKKEKKPSSSEETSPDDADGIEQILDQNFNIFQLLLGETDRLVQVMNTIVSNIIGPTFRSRSFPDNITSSILGLLLKISNTANASKAWKRDVIDSFNDPRLFSSSPSIVQLNWLPIFRSLISNDKNFVPELLSRLPTPTPPGIFGVGATTARQEADRKAQLNLRRITTAVLAAESDAMASLLPSIAAKLDELLTANATSSPSSTTRADIYLLIRALVLRTSSRQTSLLWPLINTDLTAAFSSLLDPPSPSPSPSTQPTYTPQSLLGAAKLLDLLLLLNPEDFQPQEWLFVTDTVDAVYRPSDAENWEPSAVIDFVAATMTETETGPSASTPRHAPEHAWGQMEVRKGSKPLLAGDWTRGIPEAEIRERVLRPFLGQLSIQVYERTYGMGEVDLRGCEWDLLEDLFDGNGGE